MRFSVVAAAAFAGAAIAAPAAQPIAENEKRLAGFAAFGLGSLATWAASKFGLLGRDLTLAQGDVSYEKAAELFAEDAVDFLSKKAKASEATVCIDVPYTVADESKAHDVGGFDFEGLGNESIYDCFVLSGPNTMTVDLEQGTTTPDSVAVRAGPGVWNATTGVLTL